MTQVVAFTVSVPGKAVVGILIWQVVIAEPLSERVVGEIDMAELTTPLVPVAPE